MQNKYSELPDHGHYTACSSRLREIDDKSRLRFKFTIFTTAAVCIFGAWGARVNGFSLLADLLVGREEFAGGNAVDNLTCGFLHIVMFIILTLLAFVGRARSDAKVTHIIMLAFYCFTVIQSIIHIGERRSDVAAFAVGIFGIILYIPSIADFFDFREISAAEGYPYFNERFAQQAENNHYETQYYTKPSQRTNKTMAIINEVENIEEKSENTNKNTEKCNYMDDISTIKPSDDLTHHAQDDEIENDNEE